MSVDPITMQQILKNLPEIQKRKLRAERARKQQERLQEMQQTPLDNNLGHPTQMGGLYQTVGGYVPDTAAQAQRLVGGVGDFLTGRKADQLEEQGIDQTAQEIMNTQQQMSQMKQGADAPLPEPGAPTRETLQAYLNQLGGGQGSIGLRVQSSYKADNGEIINIMSDGRHVPSGRFGDFNTKIVEGADGSVTAVGTSGAGRGVGQEVMMGGGQDVRTPPFAPPGTPAPAGAAPVAPGEASNTGWRAAVSAAQEQAESRGEQGAVSPRGARGRMQLMPATARALEQQLGLPPGSTDTDPLANKKAGDVYMDEQLAEFGNLPHALAAYNWGPGNVRSWLKQGGDMAKLPAETRKYIEDITGAVQTNAPAAVPAGAVPPAAAGAGPRPLRLPSKADEARMAAEGKIQTELAYAPQTTAAAVSQAGQVETAKLSAQRIDAAKTTLPKLEAFGAQSRNAINDLANDPELDSILGRIMGAIPDQKLNDYASLGGPGMARVSAKYNQLVGQVFLKGFETLKGGGQVTEIEGNKAQQAMSSMHRGMSKEDFIAAMNQFQAAVDEGIAKLREAAAGGNAQAAATLQGAAPAPTQAAPVSDLVSKYLNQGR